MPNSISAATCGRLVALAAALVFAGGCSTPDRADAVRGDAPAPAFRVLGSGAPALVMISGLGDDMTTFQEVAEDLSRDGTVIIFDRAGYGAGGKVHDMRDAEAVDRDLSAMLARTGVRGPYVLLGHSLGGLFAEYRAARHPDQVAGLILEESRPADFTRLCLASGVKTCAAPQALMVFSPDGARAERAALATTEAEVEAIGPVHARPVLVLSRAVGPNMPPFDVVWAKGQARLAARYPEARHLIAASGGHYLHQDERAWFVASVRAFRARTQAGAG